MHGLQSTEMELSVVLSTKTTSILYSAVTSLRFWVTLWQIQEFTEGRQPEGGEPTYYLTKFSWKLHENKETWAERGAHFKNLSMYIRPISGESMISKEGAKTPERRAPTYYFANFLPKTAWKWNNLDQRGEVRL